MNKQKDGRRKDKRLKQRQIKLKKQIEQSLVSIRKSVVGLNL